MHKWNQLPYEVILHILTELKEINGSLYPCLYVKKSWLTACQSLLYKTLIITVDQQDALFNTCLYSTQIPGRWVKNTILKGSDKEAKAATTAFSLCLFIKTCPDVEQFQFEEYTVAEDAWMYFFLPTILGN